MTGRRFDRIFLFGGLVLAALLIISGWFLMIKPKYNEAGMVQDQVEETSTQLAQLRRQLNDLNTESRNLPKYQAELARFEAALPSIDGVPAFVSKLQDAGSKVDVDVNGISVAGKQNSKTVPGVQEVPISLTVEGKIGDLSTFLSMLQDDADQPRAVVVDSATLNAGEDVKASVAVTLRAFITAPASTTAPVVTTN